MLVSEIASLPNFLNMHVHSASCSCQVHKIKRHGHVACFNDYKLQNPDTEKHLNGMALYAASLDNLIVKNDFSGSHQIVNAKPHSNRRDFAKLRAR